MFKLRLFTSAILIPLVLFSMFFLKNSGFAIVIGFFILAASWEWANLIKLKRSAVRYIYIFVLAISGYSLSIFANSYDSIIWTISIVGLLWWLYAVYEFKYGSEIKKGIMTTMAGRMLMGYLILIPAWVVPVFIQLQGEQPYILLLFLFIIVWGADSAAYFAGRRFGKNKLAPNISPGKTIEGLLGGLLMVVLITLLFGFNNWGFDRQQMIAMMVLAIVSALFSVVGDLTESRVKRIAGAKDSGSLFPGHGGVLDRIDAFTAAAPIFSLGWLIIRL